MLTDLDKDITKFVQNVNNEYIQELLAEEEIDKEEIDKEENEFGDSLRVDNSENQIEKNAINRIKELEKEIFLIDEKPVEYKDDGLRPDEIFL